MTIEFRVDGSLLPYESVRLTGTMNAGGVAGLPSAAFGGEISMGGITIEDKTGIWDFSGWQEFTVDETACSKPRIFTGWILGKAIGRGPYRSGAGRIWDCDLIDLNAAFSLKVFRASSAKRPAETDIARVAFAQASAPMAATPLFDNGFFDTTNNPISFGESDYISQYPLELFLSVAGTSGKNVYAYWDDAAGERSIYYDLMTATNRTSTLRISNVRSDYDGSTTFLPLNDARLSRTSEDTYSGVLFGYRGGYVYQQNATTLAAYIDRDLVYTTDRVGRLSTAEALTASTLAAHAGETDIITVSVQLPRTHVNLINAGERVEVKFSHLPGYETFDFIRVVRRNVVPTNGQDAWYDVHLELSAAKLSYRGPGGNEPDEFPHEPQPVSLVQYKIGSGLITLDSLPTPGNILLGWSAVRAVGAAGTWIELTDIAAVTNSVRSGVMAYKVVVSGDDTTWNASNQSASILMEWAATAVDTFAALSDQPAGPLLCGGAVTPTSSGAVAVIGGASIGDGDLDIITVTPDAGTTQLLPATASFAAGSPIGWLGYKLVSSPSGSYTVSGVSANAHDGDTRFGGVTVVLSGSAAGTLPPRAGQWVFNQTPTPAPGGGRRIFFTVDPYADGSLSVFVDLIRQTVVESNPATGEFTLAFDPQVDETLTVQYQGR